MSLEKLIGREVKYKKPGWKVEHKGEVEEVNKISKKAKIRNFKNNKLYDIHLGHITGVKEDES